MNLLKRCIGWKKQSHISDSTTPTTIVQGKFEPVFIHDAYDEYLFVQAVQALKPLAVLLEKGQKIETDFKDIVLDLFALFYKAEPEFKKEANSYRRYEYFQELLSDPSILQKRHKTRFHIFYSFVEAMTYAETFLDHSPEDDNSKKTSSNDRLDSEIIQKALKAWGISTSQQKNLELDQVIYILNLISQAPDIIHLAEQVGRLRLMTRGMFEKKVTSIIPTRRSVTLGNDILNTVPTELALLGKKETEIAFYKKAMDSSLLIYDRKTKNLQQGPIIIFIDTSDSMSGEKGYVSKAIAACLHSVAQKENRWLSVIIFSGGINAKEFVFDPGKTVPDRFVEMVTLFYGGGTSFEEGIDLGLKRLEDPNFKGADFVFLSDFDGPLDEDHLRKVQETKKLTGLRWFTLLAPSFNHNLYLMNLSDYIGEINLNFNEKTQKTIMNFLSMIYKRGGIQ